ncbi:hypothetical protein [Burkholderia gladioli]|uniref:hypothetical protein n=1 Tax=Burkholderia gladioli TaxID=28095 RepID=UPI00163EA7D6|nr:hypothetical protein [Burkholderia gladioli]
MTDQPCISYATLHRITDELMRRTLTASDSNQQEHARAVAHGVFLLFTELGGNAAFTTLDPDALKHYATDLGRFVDLMPGLGG